MDGSCRFDRHTFSGCRCAHDIERRFNDGAQVHRLAAQLELAGDDARKLDEIFDDPRLRLRVALDARHGTFDRLGIHVGRADDLQPAEHGVERCPQLVRHRGKELVLEAVALLRFQKKLVSLDRLFSG